MITISHESAGINIHGSLASSSLTSTGNIPYGCNFYRKTRVAFKPTWLWTWILWALCYEFKLHMSGIVLGLGDLSNTWYLMQPSTDLIFSTNYVETHDRWNVILWGFKCKCLSFMFLQIQSKQMVFHKCVSFPINMLVQISTVDGKL